MPHPSVGQRSVIALDFMPEMEAEAKARQGERTDLQLGGNGATKLGDTRAQPVRKIAHRSTGDAAEKVGVSPRSVQMAKTIQRQARPGGNGRGFQLAVVKEK